MCVLCLVMGKPFLCSSSRNSRTFHQRNCNALLGLMICLSGWMFFFNYIFLFSSTTDSALQHTLCAVAQFLASSTHLITTNLKTAPWLQCIDLSILDDAVHSLQHDHPQSLENSLTSASHHFNNLTLNEPSAYQQWNQKYKTVPMVMNRLCHFLHSSSCDRHIFVPFTQYVQLFAKL
jgi:hypothetical protein